MMAEEVCDEKVSALSSSVYSEDDSTSLSDELSVEMLAEDESTPLPEFDESQANILKRLLLSPLEPDMDF